jgi:hypothetical protein
VDYQVAGIDYQKKGKVKREKRISNIEQGISNDEVRICLNKTSGSLESEDLSRRTVEQ